MTTTDDLRRTVGQTYAETFRAMIRSGFPRVDCADRAFAESQRVARELETKRGAA